MCSHCQVEAFGCRADVEIIANWAFRFRALQFVWKFFRFAEIFARFVEPPAANVRSSSPLGASALALHHRIN